MIESQTGYKKKKTGKMVNGYGANMVRKILMFLNISLGATLAIQALFHTALDANVRLVYMIVAIVLPIQPSFRMWLTPRQCRKVPSPSLAVKSPVAKT